MKLHTRVHPSMYNRLYLLGAVGTISPRVFWINGQRI